MKFQWHQDEFGTSVHISQEEFIESLLEESGQDKETATTKNNPYRTGFPVDAVKPQKNSDTEKQKLIDEIRHYVG